MTIIVEDGSIVANANSYISIIDAQTYLNDRGKSVTVTEALLLNAMDVLNAQSWRGSIVSDSQALQWPRSGVTDCEGRTIESDSVPASIGYSQAMLAYNISAGNDPSAIAEKKVIQETVDVISVSYSDRGGSTDGVSISTIPEVYNLIKCYVVSVGFLGRA